MLKVIQKYLNIIFGKPKSYEGEGFFRKQYCRHEKRICPNIRLDRSGNCTSYKYCSKWEEIFGDSNEIR